MSIGETDTVRVFSLDGAIESDWTVLDDQASIPDHGSVIVPLAVWLEKHDHLTSRGDVGVWIAAGESPDDIVDDLPALPLIALHFPAFTDGRSLSAARLLRERHGYTGDLRAVGDVLIDQIPHMARCGFSTFAVTHKPTQDRLAQGLADLGLTREVPNYYQPATDDADRVAGRAWARRRSAE